ncbi:hypothetical protein [Bradyrhizobium sp. ARR65]|uniref:hypothetical protein n=1 Tax=Bradyrhizobium sp. ARR65 TaxID=1040989 RepID=UPI0004665F6D|nr:hypothetical protein [Bradyrhizobium sp. ARR65]
MTKRSDSAAALGALLSAAFSILASGALAQTPTAAQRSAIKTQCRSDYIAHCASVPPGGAASLQCLRKNIASLAPGCQSALRAVAAPSEAKSEVKSEARSDAKSEAKPEPSAEAKPDTAAPPPAETKAEPAPATTAQPAAQPAAKTTAKKPSSAQIAAVRSACRADYPNVCAGVPTGGAAALQCLEKNKAAVSPACRQALIGPSNGAPAAAANGGPAPAAAPVGGPAAPSGMVLRPMRPREVLFVMRSACGADVRTLCAGVDPGGGRILQCLTANASSLSPACKGVLARFAAQ